MQVRWSHHAREDRDEHTSYLEERSRFAADHLDARLDAAVDLLVDFPRVGPIGRVQGTRELVVRGTPYIMAYRIDQSSLVILRLMHAKQDWPTAMDDD